MKKVFRWVSLFLPHAGEQLQFRRQLQMQADQLKVDAAGLFKERSAYAELNASLFKAAGKSIELLVSLPRHRFDRLAPRTIEVVRNYFAAIGQSGERLDLGDHPARFEKLAGQLQA